MRPLRSVTAARWLPSAAGPVACRWRALSEAGTGKAGGFGSPRHYPAHAQIAAGDATGPLRALAAGWACFTRTLADGRRQVQHLLVPGDLLTLHEEAIPGSHLVAITPVTVVQRDRFSDEAWSSPPVRRSLEAIHRQLLNQIVRLGRQHANERVAHLLMELRDRLLLAGIGEERRFEMPLTQELLGDLLGLTSVHVNRTLQAMRREGLIALGGRVAELLDPAALARLADYRPAALDQGRAAGADAVPAPALAPRPGI